VVLLTARITAVMHPRVDFRRGDLPVPQRPLDQVQVTGLPIQPRGKRVVAVDQSRADR